MESLLTVFSVAVLIDDFRLSIYDCFLFSDFRVLFVIYELRTLNYELPVNPWFVFAVRHPVENFTLWL